MIAFPQTRRTGSVDSENSSPGYALMEQAGYVRPAGAAGVYSLLTLGWKSHRRICDVIFEEMELAGVFNVQLPVLQPKELWQRTGRWDKYAKDKTMFVTKEQHQGGEFGLAPTAEEIVTSHVAAELRSWRELPLRLHQIGPKFRDEVRPRSGLLRSREFSMSDAYSFDRSEEEMSATFKLFREIYARIFTRLGLEDVLAVQADSGAIGGSGSAEFMVVSEVGEDTLLVCDACGYGANMEKAASRIPTATWQPGPELETLRCERTPGITTVESLHRCFPEFPPERMVKTLIFSDRSADPDEDLVAICIRGDLAVNEVKLAGLLGPDLEPATAAQIERRTEAEVGFAGPIGLRGVTRVMFDRSVAGMRDFLCGVNETDVHALGVNFGRDLPQPRQFIDVHNAEGGHGCPECEAELVEKRGIEIGHIFQLQREYATKLEATYTTAEGHEEIPWMGCYGIGTTRLLQAIAEHTHDEHGLKWPATMAPYDISMVVATPPNKPSEQVSDAAAQALRAAGWRVFVDDRAGRVGAKFKDADLLGFPVRVVVGRGAAEGIVEVRGRAESEGVEVPLDQIEAAVGKILGSVVRDPR
jgi:prolyl-tRNA synthetase